MTKHVMEIRYSDFGLAHPRECRPDFLGCLVIPACQRITRPPAPVGRWAVDVDSAGNLIVLGLATTVQLDVLDDIEAERARQDKKWGEQNHPDGTGPETVWAFRGPAAYVAECATQVTDRKAEEGYVTWRDILLEEVAEAFAEDDPAKLRAELIQVAAVAAQWAEAIDRRAGGAA